jgi:hypothetical protein
MTELYIDKQPVVLPKDFSFEIIRENPFFTKNGTRTYEINILLDNPQNAKLYSHLNRINNRIAVLENRSACLVIDNEVILNGTEIILEITDREVKLQLVSGESELNYFIKGNIKINELDLGTVDRRYPYQEYFPIYSTNDERRYNGPSIMKSTENSIPYTAANSYHFAQPLFSHIIKLIVEALGYEIEINEIETGKFKNLYLVNGVLTERFNEMLPDWTATEFFSEIEKLFNVVFLIDEFSKKVSILSKYNYYESAQKNFIDNALNDYVKAIDKENRTDYSIGNIGYSLPDDEYFKYQNMNPQIYGQAEKVPVKSYSDVISEMNSQTYRDRVKSIIFISQDSDTEYICMEDENYDLSPKKVNAFAPIQNDLKSWDMDVEFKITPAPMHVLEYTGANCPYIFLLQAPAVQTYGDIMMDPNYDRDKFDIQQSIEDNPEAYTVSGIQLAFYTGYHTVYMKDISVIDEKNKVDYPTAFVDYLWEMNNPGERLIDDSRLCLRLNGASGMKSVYDNSTSADTTKEYKFRFIHKTKLDVKSIFVINNREFVCKELKYIANQNGILPLIEGKFYPVE